MFNSNFSRFVDFVKTNHKKLFFQKSSSSTSSKFNLFFIRSSTIKSVKRMKSKLKILQGFFKTISESFAAVAVNII